MGVGRCLLRDRRAPAPRLHLCAPLLTGPSACSQGRASCGLVYGAVLWQNSSVALSSEDIWVPQRPSNHSSFPLPSYVFGGTEGASATLNVTSQAEMPSLSSFSCFLAARCNYSVSCLRGLRARGEIGLEKDRAFSPKLLVLPGGVPLK